MAELATPQQVEGLLAIRPEQAKENSPEVFLVFCGVTALGKWIAKGERRHLARLRRYASDPRWRVREAVAIALQYFGDADIPDLLKVMQDWRKGNSYQKRAVAAALAEPRLLRQPQTARAVLNIFDAITSDMQAANDPKDEAFKVLRQTMGYAWSVVVAALPQVGKSLMEKWMKAGNADIRWVMRENLKKNRLSKMDPKWVKAWTPRVRA